LNVKKDMSFGIVFGGKFPKNTVSKPKTLAFLRLIWLTIQLAFKRKSIYFFAPQKADERFLN
jgi:hypothetical protein